jgi:hypothetical protein
MFNQHSTAHQYTPVPNALEGIDPEFINLACRLANCQPQELLAVAWRDDELVVVVQPGPKHVFTAQQIFDAGWRDGQLIRDQLNPRPQLVADLAAPTTTDIAALKAVSNAHPGELAAAEHNAPPAIADQRPPVATPEQIADATAAKFRVDKSESDAKARREVREQQEERDRQTNAEPAPARPFNTKRRP